MSRIWQKRVIALAPLLFLLLPIVAWAQAAPSADFFWVEARRVRNDWFRAAYEVANRLFVLLFLAQLVWSMAKLTLQGATMEAFASELIRQVMWFGFFYALLVNSGAWMPAVINSFREVGERGSGITALDPGAILATGLDVTVRLGDMVLSWTSLTQPFFAFMVSLASILILLSFVGIALAVLVTQIEAWVVTTAGVVLLGFGGSKWTSAYVERYLGYLVNVGMRLLVTYLIVALGLSVVAGFPNFVANLPAEAALPAVAQLLMFSVVFLFLVWMLPRLGAALISGSPQVSGGDLVTSVAGLIGASATVAIGAAAAGAGMASVGRAAIGQASRVGGDAASSGMSAMAGAAEHAVAPPSSASAGAPNSSGAVPPPATQAGQGGIRVSGAAAASAFSTLAGGEEVSGPRSSTSTSDEPTPTDQPTNAEPASSSTPATTQPTPARPSPSRNRLRPRMSPAALLGATATLLGGQERTGGLSGVAIGGTGFLGPDIDDPNAPHRPPAIPNAAQPTAPPPPSKPLSTKDET